MIDREYQFRYLMRGIPTGQTHQESGMEIHKMTKVLQTRHLTSECDWSKWYDVPTVNESDE